MQKLFCPDLLETGPVSASLMAARDGMVNFFILKAPGGLVCIDTGWRPAAVRRSFDALALNVGDVTAVLLTHLHWDHARCVSLFAHANIDVSAREVPPFFMRKTMDAHPLAVRRVCGEQVLTVGGLNVRLVETPGHTPGSVAYVIDDRLLFTGDTLRLKCGRALPAVSWFGRNGEALKHSLHKLAGLAGIECLLTAHDGLSRDTHYAFAHWVQAESALSAGGAGS